MKFFMINSLLAACIIAGNAEPSSIPNAMNARELTFTQVDPQVAVFQTVATLSYFVPSPFGSVLGKLFSFLAEDSEGQQNVFDELQAQIQATVGDAIYEQHLKDKLTTTANLLDGIMYKMKQYDGYVEAGIGASANAELVTMVDDAYDVRNYLCMKTSSYTYKDVQCDYNTVGSQTFLDSYNTIPYQVQFAPLHLNILKERNENMATLSGGTHVDSWQTELEEFALNYDTYFSWLQNHLVKKRESEISSSISRHTECTAYDTMHYCTHHKCVVNLSVEDAAGLYSTYSDSASHSWADYMESNPEAYCDAAEATFSVIGENIASTWKHDAVNKVKAQMGPINRVGDAATCSNADGHEWLSFNITQVGNPSDVDWIAYELTDMNTGETVLSGNSSDTNEFTQGTVLGGACVESTHSLLFDVSMNGQVPGNVKAQVTYKGKNQPSSNGVVRLVRGDLAMYFDANYQFSRHVEGSTMGASECTSGCIPSGPTIFEAPWTTSFQSFNYPAYYWQNAGGDMYIKTATEMITQNESSFKVVPCLSSALASSCGTDMCVSFESKVNPGYFIRHQNFLVKEMAYDYTSETFSRFSEDASFCARSSLKGDSTYQSFSSAIPELSDYYIRHSNYHLRIDQYQGSLVEDFVFKTRINDSTFPTSLSRRNLRGLN